MANPRQRSKSRSGRQTVKTTRKTTSKKVTVRGPQPLVDAWDKKKTVMQNYKEMGLMTTLAPRRPGGVEKDIKPSTGNDMEADEDEAAAGPSSKTGAIPKGYGRIVRDAEGNVVDIVMGGEEAADSDDESAAFKADKGKARAEDTPVVTALESIAARTVKRPRTVTGAELHFLKSLRAKHGSDVNAMARDMRVNRLQRTRGQIEESARRAGGWEAVESQE